MQDPDIAFCAQPKKALADSTNIVGRFGEDKLDEDRLDEDKLDRVPGCS
jgi:hypothetical protein